MLTTPYFGQSEKASLKLKQSERRHQLRSLSDFYEKAEYMTATETEQMEAAFTTLAIRLLRAKFWAFPAYTNEELAYLTACPSGTYLGYIMTRKKSCSCQLFKLIDTELRKLEKNERMPPMTQVPFPE